MSDIEIGRAKRARRAYAFDDIAVVPSRRTRDPQDVSISWTIDAFTFEIPVLAAPMDSVVSPAVAIAIGKLGGLGVLDLEGLWTRYEDPEPVLAEIRGLDDGDTTRRLQELYAHPIKPELIKERLAEIRAAGVPVAGALSPQRTQEHYRAVVDAGADLVVGHGPHLLRAVEWYRGRLIAYSLGNFASYRNFALAGPLGETAVLRVRLHADGTWAGGRLVPVRLGGTGTPALDPAAGSLATIRGLSRADIGRRAAVLRADGVLAPPAATR